MLKKITFLGHLVFLALLPAPAHPVLPLFLAARMAAVLVLRLTPPPLKEMNQCNTMSLGQRSSARLVEITDSTPFRVARNLLY
jgi:hypothetical protein